VHCGPVVSTLAKVIYGLVAIAYWVGFGFGFWQIGKLAEPEKWYWEWVGGKHVVIGRNFEGNYG
jgi:hypothetical protein